MPVPVEWISQYDQTYIPDSWCASNCGSATTCFYDNYCKIKDTVPLVNAFDWVARDGANVNDGFCDSACKHDAAICGYGGIYDTLCDKSTWKRTFGFQSTDQAAANDAFCQSMCTNSPGSCNSNTGGPYSQLCERVCLLFI